MNRDRPSLLGHASLDLMSLSVLRRLMLLRSPASLALAALVATMALPACESPPPEYPPNPTPGPPPGKPLAVAQPDAPQDDGYPIVVNATAARTPLGHYRAGQRVRIGVVDVQWTPEPSATLYDAHGVPNTKCRSAEGKLCVGEGAPLMGLILVSVPDAAAAPAGQGDPTCVLRNRLYVPSGVEFSVPFNAEVYLGPNDWEDGCFNNLGAVQVDVERARGPKEKAFERQALSVIAVSPRTFVGRFTQGEYLRVSVTGGTWSHDPGSPLIGAAGFPAQKCQGMGHVCNGGEGQPMMGLFLLMAECPTASPAPRPRVERRFIPDGVEIVLEHDADLFLAPNEPEDELRNNSGSARVKVWAFER